MAINEKNPVSQAGFQIRNAAPGAVQPMFGNAVGAAGSIGDRIQRLIVNIANPSVANLSILDGNVEYPLIVPSALVTPGPMQFELGIYSVYGPWSVRCGAGVSAVAIGSFS